MAPLTDRSRPPGVAHVGLALVVGLDVSEPLRNEAVPLVEPTSPGVGLERVKAEAARRLLPRDVEQGSTDPLTEPVRPDVELFEGPRGDVHHADDRAARIDRDPRSTSGYHQVADPAADLVVRVGELE